MVLETAADCEINASLPRLIGTGEKLAFRPCRGASKPRLFGPSRRMLWRRAQARRSSCCDAGAERIMQVLQPFSPSSSRRARLRLALVHKTARSGVKGKLAISGQLTHPTPLSSWRHRKYRSVKASRQQVTHHQVTCAIGFHRCANYRYRFWSQ